MAEQTKTGGVEPVGRGNSYRCGIAAAGTHNMGLIMYLRSTHIILRYMQ
jgi:hypothetical protein